MSSRETKRRSAKIFRKEKQLVETLPQRVLLPKNFRDLKFQLRNANRRNCISRHKHPFERLESDLGKQDTTCEVFLLSEYSSLVSPSQPQIMYNYLLYNLP